MKTKETGRTGGAPTISGVYDRADEDNVRIHRSRQSGNLKHLLTRMLFRGTENYWNRRYAKGGTSGDGSYGVLATFKANFLNDFVRDHNIRSVIEFGCGDGNQLRLARYPLYIGLDISKTSIEIASRIFQTDKTKSFFLYEPNCFSDNAGVLKADCSISLDVVYHLVEDYLYEKYMQDLFRAAKRYVIIYASNFEGRGHGHVRHRRFTDKVTSDWPDFKLVHHLSNDFPERTYSEFFVFARPGH